jgi:hypothetical protein
MRAFLPSVGAMLLASIWSAGPVQAQDKDKDKDKEKDDMHRLVIYNGGTRSVQYFGKDDGAARDRARRENAASVGDLVSDLQVRYLKNELAMEATRHRMQMLLYGYSTTFGYSEYPSGVFDGGYRGLWNGWGWGGGGGGYPAGLGTTTYGLQYGIGDEGALKRELIQNFRPGPAPERKGKE